MSSTTHLQLVVVDAPSDRRNDFLEQLEAFGPELRSEKGVPGDITSRPGKARDETISNRISQRPGDDWDRIGCLPGGKAACCSTRNNDVNVETNEVFRCVTQSRQVGFVAVYDFDVLGFDIALVSQRLLEKIPHTRGDWIR
jgi:hypothetical protein